MNEYVTSNANSGIHLAISLDFRQRCTVKVIGSDKPGMLIVKLGSAITSTPGVLSWKIHRAIPAPFLCLCKVNFRGPVKHKNPYKSLCRKANSTCMKN